MQTIGTVIGIAIIGLAGAASAHTISIGDANAGPGSVDFWYGSYHEDGIGDGPDSEGSFNLIGVNGNLYPSTTVPFSLTATTKPAGLIDGVTNFYASGPLDGSGPLTPTNTLPSPRDVVNSWQGVLFTGLAAGDYRFTYIPIAVPSQHWAPWNEAVRSNAITLTGTVVNGVPEPATLGLVALGLAGLGISRRRKPK